MRKSGKTGLRSNAQLFRSIFDNAQIGISFFSVEGREAFTNRAFQQMLGYSEEELSHLENWDRIVHPDDRASSAKRYAELQQGKRDITERKKVEEERRITTDQTAPSIQWSNAPSTEYSR